MPNANGNKPRKTRNWSGPGRRSERFPKSKTRSEKRRHSLRSRHFLENGLKWLSGKQKSFVSSKVLYQVENDSFEVNAVLGRTKYEIVDDYGFKISTHSIDFLIAHDELGFIPRVGHRIVYNDTIHEVLELGDECWRWCDPHGITRRIHTKQI